MPRTEGANQRLREAQRAKILDAARTVFARKGMAATMDDIAAMAAVSHGLAYRYFASKEALLSALVEQVLQSSSTLISHILEMTGTPGQRLDVLITRSVAVWRRRRNRSPARATATATVCQPQPPRKEW